MTKAENKDCFASLFKKYRLRSGIATLKDFGDLLAKEGIVYEDSLFTRWQNGERIPKERKILLSIIKIFLNQRGIYTEIEANQLLECAGQGYLTDSEQEYFSLTFRDVSYKVPIAGLGDLLRKYRIQKNSSQLEFSLSMGWKDNSQLAKIEQGIIERPSRQLLERMSKILMLQNREKNNLLLAGNYLPTKADIVKILKPIMRVLENWPYSGVLYDFCWRVIYINKKHAEIIGISEEERQKVININPAAIEIIFDKNFIANRILKGKDKEIWHKNLLRFLIHFKSLHKTIIKDQWYLGLIQRMMKNDLFRDLWSKTQGATRDIVTTRHGRKVFITAKDKKRLNFNIFIVPLLEDPRFEIELYTPADVYTFHYFQKIS